MVFFSSIFFFFVICAHVILFTFWNFVCFPYLQTVTQGYPKYEIAGMGFDATCSMVAIDTENNPLTVSTTGECRSDPMEIV